MSDTKRPRYSSVGGYPLLYLVEGDEVLCASCCDELGEDGQACVNWEDPHLYCAECSDRIEEAYPSDEEQSDG